LVKEKVRADKLVLGITRDIEEKVVNLKWKVRKMYSLIRKFKTRGREISIEEKDLHLVHSSIYKQIGWYSYNYFYLGFKQPSPILVENSR
jgi:hypothetical protein